MKITPEIGQIVSDRALAEARAVYDPQKKAVEDAVDQYLATNPPKEERDAKIATIEAHKVQMLIQYLDLWYSKRDILLDAVKKAPDLPAPPVPPVPPEGMPRFDNRYFVPNIAAPLLYGRLALQPLIQHEYRQRLAQYEKELKDYGELAARTLF